MAKGKFIALLKIAHADRVLDRDNAARIPNIISLEQFKHFIDEVSPLLSSAKVEKFHGESTPDNFPSKDMFVYPLAFRVSFKLPLHQ